MSSFKNHIALIRTIVIWAVFLTLPLYFIPDLIKFDERGYTPIYINLFSGLLAISIFYFAYSFVVPKYFEQKKYLAYFLSIIVSVLLLLFLLQLFTFVIGVSPSVLHFKASNRLAGSLLPRVVLVLVAAHYIFNNVKSKRVIVEKEKAELQLLKSQIAPHFLFNTLNSLYSLAIVKSDKTAQGILDLSDLMRYVISEAQKEKVLLKAELDHLQKFVSLQKTRLTNETSVEFTLNGDFDSLKIAPLLLIYFVENAFKYGVSTEGRSIISIDVTMNKNKLIFFVLNDKIGSPKEQDKTKSGLENVRNRLNLIYGKKHALIISENEKSYEVNLEIELS